MELSLALVVSMIVGSVVQIGLGVAIGLWLKGRGDTSKGQVESELSRAREYIGRLQEYATDITDDVAKHSSRVKKISDDLAAAPIAEQSDASETVTNSVEHIIAANQKLQAQLSAAKTKLDEQAQQLQFHKQEARIDALTGLSNRRALDDEMNRRFAEWWRTESPLSLLMIDVDHFKKFNDTYGHQTGDYVLKEIGPLMTDAVRGMDFVARFGGEEFAVLLPDTQMADAAIVAERIRNSIASAHFKFEGKEFKVTISLGLAMAQKGDQTQSLVKRADTALYASKQNGRNRGYFHNGQSCEPIQVPVAVDPRSGQTDTNVAETPADRNGVERRASKRGPFAKSQLIAPYGGNGRPDKSLFYEVECHDISGSGFSFITPESPKFKSLVLVLGAAPNMTYMTAEITNRVEMTRDDETLYRVGCRFTGRIS